MVLAAHGDGPSGEALAREAVERAASTDDLNLRAGALLDLADILRRKDEDEANAAMREALELFERKGNVVMAERTRARLAELGQTPRSGIT
jgi:hypothetical protein